MKKYPSFEKLYNTPIVREVPPAPYKGKWPTRVVVKYWMFGREYNYVGVPEPKNLLKIARRLQHGQAKSFFFAEFDRTGIVGLNKNPGPQRNAEMIVHNLVDNRVKANYYHPGMDTGSWWQLAIVHASPTVLPCGKVIYWEPGRWGRPTGERMRQMERNLGLEAVDDH